jgi:DNA invertase Pin-like site-specific DNA recombinase
METCMIACYCRVSTYDQKPDSQQTTLQRWLNGNGIEPNDVQWFEDTETGTTTRRPAFEALQRAVFAGEVKTIVVWKLDRISRNQKDGITLLADWCERGVRVVSVTQQIDLSGSVGRLIASVLFGIAEIEREHLRERQAAGIAVAKERGVYRGRKRGSSKAIPKRAWELRRQGLNKTEIARALGVTPQTVWRYLKQEPKQPKTMRVELYLRVENNNKFVRGKSRSRDDIEWRILHRYQMEKPHKDSHRYFLTIPYETDEELDRIIYEDILGEADRIADLRNGFIEADVISLDEPGGGPAFV